MKKPFLHIKDDFGYITLGSDRGVIDEEEYLIKICAAGPLFNQAAMEVLLF